MKNALLSVLLLGCTTAGIAQPVLTNQCNPASGDVQRLKLFTGAPAPGAGGANATWDYSGFSGTDEDNTFEPCPAQALCSIFPGSSLILESGADMATAYITSQSSLSVNGISVNGVDYVYSNPMEILRYPFTFNDSYRDSFVCDYTSMSNVAFTREGAIDVKADGYGTLILPHDTFTNLLRVKSEEVSTDFILGYATFFYQTISYYWYDPNTRDMIARHATYYISGRLSGEVLSYTRNTQSGTSDPTDPTDPSDPSDPSVISDMTDIINQSLRIFPNPATNTVQLRFSAETGKNIRIQILDMTGRAVQAAREISTIPGPNEVRLGTDGLTSGMYFLKIRTDRATINRKIEIRK